MRPEQYIQCRDALDRAISISAEGNVSKFVRLLLPFCTDNRTLTQASVWKWQNRSVGPVPPAEWVLPIEEISGVSRHELRPDIYPLDDSQDAA